MKDQVLRILRMVQEGRLSPDDALDLMDAFVDFEQERATTPGSESPPETPPQTEPTGGPASSADSTEHHDPFRRFVDSVDKLTREKFSSVNWNEIAEGIRDAARRGAESVRSSVEQLASGEVIGSWFGQDEARECVLPLSLKSGDTVRIAIASGAIEVLGGSHEPKLRASVRVKARTREEAKQKAAAWTPVLEEHDGIVTLRGGADLSNEVYKLEVPEGVNVDLQVKAGDVTIRGTRGGAKITANSGDIVCEGVAGIVEIKSGSGDVSLADGACSSVMIESQSGDVELERITGSMKLRSANGDIEMKKVHGDSIAVETVNGDIELDMSESTDGQMNVRTVYGDVEVSIATGTNARVSLSSINGTVKCHAPLNDERASDDRVTGCIGEGTGTIDISAVSGDVELNLRASG